MTADEKIDVDETFRLSMNPITHIESSGPFIGVRILFICRICASFGSAAFAGVLGTCRWLIGCLVTWKGCLIILTGFLVAWIVVG
jgi:hypothetical protein